MDLNKKVIVLTPNGRRQNIKITASTTLLQILEEACQKHGFCSEDHGLKNHNKELDLSQMFRFTGLPNNCLLEMFECQKKRVESEADICVQLEDGTRCQGQFVPSSNLWDVLTLICPEYTNSDKSPVFVYMRKEIFGDELKGTTLKSLGIIGGRTMFRLLNKQPEEIKTQAGVYVPPVVKETPKDSKEDETKSKSKAIASTGFAITSELVQSLKKKQPSEEVLASSKKPVENPKKEIEKPKVTYDWGSGFGRTISSGGSAKLEEQINEDAMEVEPVVNVVGERNAVIYSLDSTQKQMEDLPDSFYDLTVTDLKLVLRDLKKVSEGNEDTPLLTAKLRELEENKTLLRKIARYRNCIIRIQFPDRYVLQAIFKPTEKVADVVDFVRGFIINEDLRFHLFTIPPKHLLPLDKTLLEVNCVPTAVLHFGVNENEALPSMLTYLKNKFLLELTTPEGAFFAASKSRLMRVSNEEDSENNNSSRLSTAPGPSTGAIPKRPRNDCSDISKF